ncbi:MAG: MlaE family lipid ABC transporter permease subunit [Candidatus Brocadiales bacterium]|nr:MlaE family lipid ABC transporter permease subunit [Candidatus Bathyanammoxibius amoris]
MKKTKTAPDYNITVVEEGPELMHLKLSGNLYTANSSSFLSDLNAHLSGRLAREIKLDFSGIDYFDSTAAAVITQTKANLAQRGCRVVLSNLKPEIQKLFNILNLDSLLRERAHLKEKRPGLFLRAGTTSISFAKDVVFTCGYLGDVTLGLCYAVRYPHKIRWGEVFFYIERTGIEAIPIVLLINFLVGFIMGFQAAVQLKQFGANIYVANLVGLSVVRELGPLMTAIIVAGRSGSAFAAEIGTMKVSEEIDAIKSMGLDTTRFLIVPKVIATVVALPILTLMADLVGIFGGLVVGVLFLDLTIWTYILQTERALDVFDIFTGVFKSFVFALLISGIGCMRGLQVEGGAQGVGRLTTSAVVSGIFLIIMSDTLFTLLFNYVKW